MIRQYFEKVLSEPDLEKLELCWNKTITLERHEFLSLAGSSSSYLYFIEKGAAAIFSSSQSENHYIGFGYDNSLLLDFPSFVNNTTSDFSIQVLKKTILKGIHRKDFYNLLETSADFNRWWIRQLEQAICGHIVRLVDLQIQSPEERLDRLLHRSPQIFQNIPLKYIAAYLRMKPETLSRKMAKS